MVNIRDEESWSEWCISSMIYSRDIPLWSETLDTFSRSKSCSMTERMARDRDRRQEKQADVQLTGRGNGPRKG